MSFIYTAIKNIIYPFELLHLELQHARLQENIYDYDLISAIEDLRNHHLQSTAQSIISSAREGILDYIHLNVTTLRINHLYNQIFDHHHLPQDYLNRCEQLFNRALEQRDYQRLEFLGKKMNPFQRGPALVEAIRINDLQLLNILLQSGEIMDYDRGNALKKSLDASNTAMAHVLINSGPISPFFKSECLAKASEQGFLSIVESLLALPQPITQQNLSWCARNAIRNNHMDVLRAILNYQNIDLSEEVYAAIFDGNLERLQNILNHQALSQAAREEAIFIAATQGQPEMLRILIQNQNISALLQARIMLYANIARRDEIQHIALTTPLLEMQGLLKLSFEELQSDPEKFLQLVIEQGFPNRIELHNAEGTPAGVADLGGVRKGFVTTLFLALGSRLNLDSNQVPLIDPQAPNSTSSQSFYRQLGQFFSRLLEANQTTEDPFLIGSIFHEKFFEILQIVANQPSIDKQRQEVAQLLLDINPQFSYIANIILNPDDNAKYLQEYDEIFGPFERSPLVEATSVIDSYLIPARSFLEGCSQDLHQEIQQKPYPVVAHAFQGNLVTKESLIQALTLEEDPTELLLQQSAWIQEKILDEDLSWSVKFVKWVTERTSLPHNTRILLQSSHGHLQPHTCTNTIDISAELNEKSTFFAALDAVLDSPINRA